MLAIGNDELGEPVGKTIKCHRCGKRHTIKYGKSRRLLDDGTWSPYAESKLLGFVKCGGEDYLASVNGKSLNK